MSRAMSEQIDLDKSAYRHFPNGPLGRPRQLWFIAIASLTVSCVTAIGAWIVGGPFAVFVPIPSAVYAGIAIAGLFPRYWFKEPPSST